MFIWGVAISCVFGQLLVEKRAPLLLARDSVAYAEITTSGVKFYTAFTDGTLLISANYQTMTSEGPEIFKRWRIGGIGEIWAEHEARVRSLEAAGRRADRRSDFETYAEMMRREYGAA